MNDLQHLFNSLPIWVQAIAFIILAALGVGLGRKRSQRSRPTAKPQPILKQTSHQSVSHELLSPGQAGLNATRDMTSEEVRTLRPSYHPSTDGDPDPGEVIWTWVPYAENDGRGKDRPVLILARIDAQSVAGCFLSTKQHRDYLEVGTGKWDSQRRPSYLNPKRVLRVRNEGMRREGAVMPRNQYQNAVRQIVEYHRELN